MIPVFGEVTCLSILVDVATIGAVSKSVATFREVRERVSRLDKETNEHVDRALLRAHYKSAKEVFLRAKEQSTDGASLLPDAPPQPTFNFINAQIRILADELPKERLQILQDEWRKALDASLSEYDASPANAAEDFHFRLAEAAGKQFKHDIHDWYWTSPDAAERARHLFTAEDGYPSLFRAALWQEFKSTKRPEFRKVYGALLQRETAQGIAALQDSHEESTKTILEELGDVKGLIGDSTRLLSDQADQHHQALTAQSSEMAAKIDTLISVQANRIFNDATRSERREAQEDRTGFSTQSPASAADEAAMLIFKGQVDEGFALLMQSASVAAVSQFREIASKAEFVRIQVSVAAMQKVCAIAPEFLDWIRLSQFAVTAGDLSLAASAAHAAGSAATNPTHKAIAWDAVGDVQIAQGRIADAGTSFQAAYEIREQAHDDG